MQSSLLLNKGQGLEPADVFCEVTWETWTSTGTKNRWEMASSHRVCTKAEKPLKATLERMD